MHPSQIIDDDRGEVSRTNKRDDEYDKAYVKDGRITGVASHELRGKLLLSREEHKGRQETIADHGIVFLCR